MIGTQAQLNEKVEMEVTIEMVDSGNRQRSFCVMA